MASASPRRKELLADLIEKFEIIPAKGEEEGGDLPPEALVKALAAQKATEVSAQAQARGKAVLGADTIVVLDNEVLGKPRDEADAKRMLSALSGRTHKVYTGVCIRLVTERGVKEWLDIACTEVVFETLTKAQIDKYVATGSPMDKAGAYGIQDGGLVKEIKGSYSNVVGLPTELCKELIAAVLRYAEGGML